MYIHTYACLVYSLQTFRTGILFAQTGRDGREITQIDVQMDRQTDRYIYRQTDRWKDAVKEMDRHMNIHTQTYICLIYHNIYIFIHAIQTYISIFCIPCILSHAGARHADIRGLVGSSDLTSPGRILSRCMRLGSKVSRTDLGYPGYAMG